MMGIADDMVEYKGFFLRASVFRSGNGFASQVVVIRHNPGNTRETILSPPWPVDKFKSEHEAYDAVIEYGKTAINGGISGVDLTVLYG